MASTNLIAHLIAGLSLIFLVWLWWQEKKITTTLRYLYLADRDWILSLNGPFLLDALAAAGIDNDCKKPNTIPVKIPIKTVSKWLLALPRGSFVFISENSVTVSILQNQTKLEESKNSTPKKTTNSLNLPQNNSMLADSMIDEKISELQLLSKPLEDSIQFKFFYNKENNYV